MSLGERSAGQPTRNLLIVHSVGYEDISDWETIKRQVESQAPDIEVRIANNFEPTDSTLVLWQFKRPTLVFSASHLAIFHPNCRAVYAGRRMAKSDQIERLAQQGLPVPPTLRLSRDMARTIADWGQYLIVKPDGGGRGRDVRLVETRNLSARIDEFTRNGTYPMIVQPYIEHSTDGHPIDHRVLTLFGHVLYSARNRRATPRLALDKIASDPQGIIASNDSQSRRERTLCNDAEIIALGEQAYSAFPECAVLGVDIIRESGTGKLFVMEANPEGLTWHFSSNNAKRNYPAEYLRQIYSQFSALDRVAKLLIEKTRAEAT